MVLYYKTKTTKNGRTDALRIDTTEKTFSREVIPGRGDVTVTGRRYREMLQELKDAGYQEERRGGQEK